jgi:hypothetical protein
MASRTHPSRGGRGRGHATPALSHGIGTAKEERDMETSTFVSLHDTASGRQVLINIDTVRRIDEDGSGGAKLTFTEADYIFVQETPEQVLRRRFLALPAIVRDGIGVAD